MGFGRSWVQFRTETVYASTTTITRVHLGPMVSRGGLLICRRVFRPNCLGGGVSRESWTKIQRFTDSFFYRPFF